MPRRSALLVLALSLVLPAGARATEPVCGGPVQAEAGPNGTRINNGCVERVWQVGIGSGITTTLAKDLRSGFASGIGPDFHLELDGARIPSSALIVLGVKATGSGTDRARITWSAVVPGIAGITRTVEAYAGVAGFESQTTIDSLVPAPLNAYTLDEVRAHDGTATLHSFHAGADWREPDWEPMLSIGDSRSGDWRQSTTGAPGEAIEGTSEWISLATPFGESVGIVSERRDYASSVGSYDGAVVSGGVDLSRDIVYTGPFEEDIHAENPGPGPARHRIVEPGVPLVLERAFTIFGEDADDEMVQFSKYLTEYRATSYRRAIAFNSDGVDSNAISTGAKDDMNFDRFKAILPAVREMGADTFVFDDGWMARSGDWCPDSPTCTEPRWDGHPNSKFRPRFPDDTFAAVREYLRDDPRTPEDDADVALGLWMTPMAFHPSSEAFRTNPQWSCLPVGTGTALLSVQDPNSGSNEPGIGLWNPRALGVHPDDGVTPIRLIDYIEQRILRAIEIYGASYFKFDFLVWVDCGGATPVTMYEYRDEFMSMLDRVQAVHPEVTLQIDDTNDYRGFPYETIARGPSWFLNGGPDNTKILHTVWNLAPYVPGSALGLRALNKRANIDAEMAAAITSHLTFSFPIDQNLTAQQRAQVRRWTDFYAANRDTIGGFTFPLLPDPNAKAWTALQPWDADTRSGWLLAYRQQDARASVEVPLRGLGLVPDQTIFDVTRVDPAHPEITYPTQTMTAATLRAGLTVDAVLDGYAIYRITPAA